MLEFGGGAADAPATDLIKDGSEATFMTDVIDASKDVPIIVDFWASWCGPCKTLGPALEAAVTAAKGRVKMVKIDVDRNQGIAAQLRIQSIPTVYAFFQGKPIDGFQGALPQSEIQAFVDRIAAHGGGGGLDDAVQAGEAMLAEGAAVEAAQTFAAVLSQDAANAAAYGGLIRAHLAMGEIDRAQTLLDNAAPEIAAKAEVEAAAAQLELARQAQSAGPVDELVAQVEANPDDHQARFDLANALHAQGRVEDAIDQLLESFRRNREWHDGAAKAQLFTIFDALKPHDPIALNGRRRLSSMIFV